MMRAVNDPCEVREISSMPLHRRILFLFISPLVGDGRPPASALPGPQLLVSCSLPKAGGGVTALRELRVHLRDTQISAELWNPANQSQPVFIEHLVRRAGSTTEQKLKRKLGLTQVVGGRDKAVFGAPCAALRFMGSFMSFMWRLKQERGTDDINESTRSTNSQSS